MAMEIVVERGFDGSRATDGRVRSGGGVTNVPNGDSHLEIHVESVFILDQHPDQVFVYRIDVGGADPGLVDRVIV